MEFIWSLGFKIFQTRRVPGITIGVVRLFDQIVVIDDSRRYE